MRQVMRRVRRCAADCDGDAPDAQFASGMPPNARMFEGFDALQVREGNRRVTSLSLHGRKDNMDVGF
jgi:hypothetical protein